MMNGVMSSMMNGTINSMVRGMMSNTMCIMTSILIGGIVAACIRYITKYDTSWNRSFQMGEKAMIVGAIVAEGVMISLITLQDGLTVIPNPTVAVNLTFVPIQTFAPILAVIPSLVLMLIMTILLSILSGALLFACITDMLCTQVYRFTWWLAWGGGLLMIAIQISVGGINAPELVSILMFAVLQEVLFAKMYGRADCHAFLACAMAEVAFGMSLREFLIHMALSFGILTVVQIFKQNINRKGNLKHPVPFLPYITVGFWAVMLLNAFVARS